MTPNAERAGVVFGVENNVPVVGGNGAHRREHDKRRGAGTMTRSGAQCPCCPAIMTNEDIRLEAQAGRLAVCMMAAVIDGLDGRNTDSPRSKRSERQLSALPSCTHFIHQFRSVYPSARFLVIGLHPIHGAHLGCPDTELIRGPKSLRTARKWQLASLSRQQSICILKWTASHLLLSLRKPFGAMSPYVLAG